MPLPNQFGKTSDVIAGAQTQIKKNAEFSKRAGIDNIMQIREMMIEAGTGSLLPSGGKSYHPKSYLFSQKNKLK